VMGFYYSPKGQYRIALGNAHYKYKAYHLEIQITNIKHIISFGNSNCKYKAYHFMMHIADADRFNIKNRLYKMMKTTIGWIGLGRMGVPMAKRLMEDGYPVMVYNRTRGKESVFSGEPVPVALSPADLIKQTNVVVVMVSDDYAIREIFTGTDGLLGAGVSEKIIINMSTVSPDISKEMAGLCSKQGNHYLDAPVSGSVKQAETGTLVVMAGGEEDVFLKVKPILEQLSKLAIRVGNTGAGNKAKLAVDYFGKSEPPFRQSEPPAKVGWICM